MSANSPREPVEVKRISPSIGIPGGEVTIFCENLDPVSLDDDSLAFCGSPAKIIAASRKKLITQIPEDAWGKTVKIIQHGLVSNESRFIIPRCIANSLHLLTSPTITGENQVLATFCGMSGQLTPVSIFRVDPHHDKEPVSSGLDNIGAVHVSQENQVWAISRSTGALGLIEKDGSFTVKAEGFNSPCALAGYQDRLYLSETNGSIYQVDPDGRSEKIAQVQPSESCVHLATSKEGVVYATSTQKIGENTIWKIDDRKEVVFARALAEFNGLNFDITNTLYVATNERSKGGIDMYHLSQARPKRVIAGQGFVGLVFGKNNELFLATTRKIYLVQHRHLITAWNTALEI